MDFTVVSVADAGLADRRAERAASPQRARDYMSLKTTVTWAEMGPRKPVVLQTMVAAPVGAGGGLVVSVTGATGQAVPSIPLTLSSGGGAATTDASGCARWDAVSAGTGYSLSASVPGYVQPNGEQDVSITGLNIAAEETAQKSFAYDRGGSVRLQFQQKTTGASTWTQRRFRRPAGRRRARGQQQRHQAGHAGLRRGRLGRALLPVPVDRVLGVRRQLHGREAGDRLAVHHDAHPGRRHRAVRDRLARPPAPEPQRPRAQRQHGLHQDLGQDRVRHDHRPPGDRRRRHAEEPWPALRHRASRSAPSTARRRLAHGIDNTSYNAPSATTTNILTLPLVSGGSCPFATT